MEEIFQFADLILGDDYPQEQSGGSHLPAQPSPSDGVENRKSEVSILENRLELRTSARPSMTDSEWEEYFYQQLPLHKMRDFAELLKSPSTRSRVT
jgi:hypothetical protein